MCWAPVAFRNPTLLSSRLSLNKVQQVEERADAVKATIMAQRAQCEVTYVAHSKRRKSIVVAIVDM